MGESTSQVDSDLDIIPTSTNPITNGKRGAEKVVDPQVAGSKKQKVVNGDVETVNEDQHSSLLSNQEQAQQNKVEVRSSIKSTALQESKKASCCNEFEQDDREDNSNMENDPHMETSVKSVELPPATKSVTTQEAERTSISTEHEEEDRDDSSKEVYMATERTEHSTETSHATGSKTLFLGNLSFAVEEDDVRDFFKDVGEIAAIRFVIRDDRFLGYGYIEFTTAEAAREALKLNKEVLLDRQVRLELTTERSVHTPNNSMEKAYRRGVQAQGKTIFIRGFDSSDDFDNIKNALKKHFGKCGEISRMSIPTNHESGAPKGIAFVDFADRNGVRLALRLDGSEIAGSRLTVEEAKRQKGDVREASAYGLRGWIRGSGSGGGWVRDGGSFSGSSRGNGSIGGWGRENGSGYGSVRGSGFGRESGLHRESGYGSSSGRESGFSSDSRRECGSGSSWHRDSVSGSSWHRESVSAGSSRRESGYGSDSRRESGPGSSWPREYVSGSVGSRRESGYGRGSGSESGSGRESRSGSSWRGISSDGLCRGNENVYGRGGGRESDYSRGGSWGYRSGYDGGGFSGVRVGGGRGWGGGSGYSSGRVGGGSGSGGGGRVYSGSRTGRFSSSYGSGRGGGLRP